ncbi:hypothetical protein BX285_5407 [Streptomyces sp. 1114.5]|uniref:hypothetical protein n=1 Tax=unclassified Streptomyces TaxID=2593676 RepID=UPI000BD3204F|nr:MULTISPECIES: hypothetical protein [unclassified Streptomyces]RKT11457.1 hypothetical protein BX285_5407 [Streptomyces sp. 1114.5]SOB81167.1 hypothetical protein SAMN06272789_1320 [Streptomyces sp. 1331.2]
MSSPPAAPAPRWPLILLRTTATALAVLALLQVMLAGSFLNGTYDSLKDHEDTAMLLATVVVVQLAAAVVVRWPGRGPLWPLWTTGLLTAAVIGQIAAGYARSLGVHVTLGVLLVSGLLFGLVGAWRLPLPARSEQYEAGPDGSGRLPRPGAPLEVSK